MALAMLLVGDDGSTCATVARDWAESLARGVGAGVLAVRVVEPATGSDSSSAAGRALEWAAALAGVARAEVIVVHALNVGPAFAMAGLEDAYATARARVSDVVDREWSAPLREKGSDYSTVVEEGGAAGTLIAVARARDADLLVVGRQSQGAFPGISMGSAAHRALGFAPCPTVVVPTRP